MIKAITILRTDKSWQERRRAARSLRHDPSAEALIALKAAIDDIDDEVAQVAIISLVYANCPDVAQYITKPRFLLSTNSTLRWSVAHALSKFGNKSHFEFLLRMSEDVDWTVRDEVFSAFDKILSSLMAELESANNDAVDAEVHLLIRMLQIRQKGVRQKIYTILVAAFRNLSLDILFETLGGNNVLVETGVINVLGLLGQRSTIPRLAEQASSKAVLVRLEVVRNVCLLGGPEAINVLIIRLGDGEQRVVAAAIKALTVLKDEPLFSSILIDRLKHVQNVTIRKNILLTMGRTNDPRFIPSLFENIGSPFYYIRQASTEALAQYKELVYERVIDILNPEPISIAPFIKICKESSRIQARIQAIELIGKSRDPNAVKFLENLFVDPSEEIVAAAEDALASIFKSNWERANCAHILGDIGNAGSVRSLLKVLSDWSIEVRSEAIGALRKLHFVESPDEIILAFKTEKDAQNRSEIIASLGNVSQVNNKTKPTIISALEDKSQLVRQQAARMLRLLGTQDGVIERLLSHLADEAIDVRTACLNSLFTLGEAILDDVRRAFAESDKPYITFHCMNLIGLLGDKSMEPKLTDIAEKEPSAFLAQRAKIALRVLKNNRETDRELLFSEHQ